MVLYSVILAIGKQGFSKTSTHNLRIESDSPDPTYSFSK